MTIHRFASIAAVLVLCGRPWSGAFAQTPEAGARSTSLFGGSSSQLGAHPRSIDASLSVSTAHDDDLSGAQGVFASPLLPRAGGEYSDLDGFLSFVETRPRLRVAMRASGTLRRYHDLDHFVGSSGSAGIVVSANVARRTTVRSAVDLSYVSSFAFDTFARRMLDQPTLSLRDLGTLSPAGLENASLEWTTSAYGGAVDITQMLGPSATMRLTYGRQHSVGLLLGDYNDDQTLVADVGRGIGRDATLRVAYTFHYGDQLFADKRRFSWAHDVQIGIERQWRHNASRRTTFSLAAGPALSQRLSVSEEGSRVRRSPVVGNVAIDHELSRTWTARLLYRRGAGFRDSRILSNTASADLRGLIGRRLELMLSAGYFDRDLPLELSSARYRTWFGSGRLQFAVARFLAAYAQYAVDRYTYGSGAGLPPGTLAQADRRGLRFGINVWAPLRRR